MDPDRAQEMRRLPRESLLYGRFKSLEGQDLALKGKRFSSLIPTPPNKSHSSAKYNSPAFVPFRAQSGPVHAQNTDKGQVCSFVEEVVREAGLS